VVQNLSNTRHPCFHVVITKVTRIKGTHHASRNGKGRANDAQAVTGRSTAICHHLQLVQQRLLSRVLILRAQTGD
jgi:hypothetical protein